ncbi:MAG: lipid-A-disaccharide synthase [Candidatus Omnitrophica bacterium]|nr:lipid-A-disaccharide synthase [Candidatus Omnitrophota bacterium]
MDRSPTKILIVAGEESGDMRGAALVAAARNLRPDIHFIGIAGNRCRQAGVETFADITDLAVIGFMEVLKNIHRIKRIFDLTLERARIEKPSVAILVDYPGFNLRLAKELKKLGIKVVYYVSPQIWAWKESRVHTIKKVVDRMMVLFPFEKELYAKHGYNADFVGHPLVDEAIATVTRTDLLNSLNLNDKKPVLGILPGSRDKEISRHLPIMLEAAALVQKGNPDIQLVLLKARNLDHKTFDPYIAKAPQGLKVSEDYYNALNACDAAIVCSGTATLETGLMQKPMVVIYKTSWVTWFLARLLIKIPYIALVNIVAGKKIAEELLQECATPQRIANETLKLLDPQQSDLCRQKLSCIKSLLGQPGASLRAAQVVIQEIK